MFVLDARLERIVAILLAVAMAATRIHHFGIGAVAPDASTAVFFLAGLMLASPVWFGALAVLAIALDSVALGPLGIADACMTPGYWLLFAGYLALWFAGRLGRSIERLHAGGAARLAVLLVAGIAAFFMLSNVGYYFGGGFDVSMGAAEYTARVSRYFPIYLITTLAYSIAGVVLFRLATGPTAVAGAK